jgi:hypothetical protein
VFDFSSLTLIEGALRTGDLMTLQHALAELVPTYASPLQVGDHH